MDEVTFACNKDITDKAAEQYSIQITILNVSLVLIYGGSRVSYENDWQVKN